MKNWLLLKALDLVERALVKADLDADERSRNLYFWQHFIKPAVLSTVPEAVGEQPALRIEGVGHG